MTYPFTRVLYFLTNEGNFNIANGFIRYSCTQLGQMIVQRRDYSHIIFSVEKSKCVKKY
ncbi:hypothetical protein ACFP3I_25195 [Chryseobacterium arachidis]|uniref:hypothetical protein n=1 Tax=Chryseobacterium arachidis TaxID=1416778 RepID=UPI00360F0F57